MKTLTPSKGLPFFFLLIALFLSACTKDSDIETLKEQMEEQREVLTQIRSDIDRIKTVIEEATREATRATPQEQERTVSIDDDYIKGDPKAKITMIEFSDFQCPFCARFYREVLPQIEKEYIRTGKVRLVYRDFPLDDIHPNAQKAGEAAQCAGEQGKFWEMHDKLFDHYKTLEVAEIKKYAKEVGLAMDRFNRCLDSGTYAQEVRKDLADGKAAGVSGTPTFFIGYTRDGKTIQGRSIRGAMPFSVFQQIFDRMLQPD